MKVLPLLYPLASKYCLKQKENSAVPTLEATQIERELGRGAGVLWVLPRKYTKHCKKRWMGNFSTNSQSFNGGWIVPPTASIFHCLALVIMIRYYWHTNLFVHEYSLNTFRSHALWILPQYIIGNNAYYYVFSLSWSLGARPVCMCSDEPFV